MCGNLEKEITEKSLLLSAEAIISWLSSIFPLRKTGPDMGKWDRSAHFALLLNLELRQEPL
jgi:hypothetical protein